MKSAVKRTDPERTVDARLGIMRQRVWASEMSKRSMRQRIERMAARMARLREALCKYTGRVLASKIERGEA